MVSTVLFYLFAACVVYCAIRMVTARNVFHAALFLAATLFGISGLYVMLDSFFLAALQILVYIGAVVILTVFVINLTRDIVGERTPFLSRQIPMGILTAVLTAGLVILAVIKSKIPASSAVASFPDDTERIGRTLMGDLVLPFEIASALLLAALIAAIVIVTKEKGEDA
jgi:NADH-quinone oxidoreductase subunit J